MDTILFDLDGTLLPMDANEFERTYFGLLSKQFTDLHTPNEFIAMVWDATKQMVKNTEYKTNKHVFLEALSKHIDETMIDEYYARFMSFYNHEFDLVAHAVSPTPMMKQAVEILKSKGYTLVVATNPMFPKVAIEKRIQWANLHIDDFTYVTSFENNHYCKPQIQFYEEILSDLSKNPSDCLMVGNDSLEDLIVSKLGMKTYLIENHSIVREQGFTPTYQGKYEDFLKFVQTLPVIAPDEKR